MNYYRARGWPRVSASETRSPLEHFLQRMRELGAGPDELEAAAAAWGFDPDDDARLAAMSDRELRADILAVREEFELGTISEEESSEHALAVAYRQTLAEAQGRVGGTIPAVMAWVADDPVRAYAVRSLETDGDGAGRSTLVNQLDKILTGDETASQLAGVLTGTTSHDGSQGRSDGPTGVMAGGEG